MNVLRVGKPLGFNRVFLRQNGPAASGGFCPKLVLVTMMEWEDELLESWRFARSTGHLAHSAALFQTRQAVQRAMKYLNEYLDIVQACQPPAEDREG